MYLQRFPSKKLWCRQTDIVEHAQLGCLTHSSFSFCTSNHGPPIAHQMLRCKETIVPNAPACKMQHCDGALSLVLPYLFCNALPSGNIVLSCCAVQHRAISGSHLRKQLHGHSTRWSGSHAGAAHKNVQDNSDPVCFAVCTSS